MNAGAILESASSIVEGSRQQTYGNKERSFDTIASFWNTYLRLRGVTTMRLIEGVDVAHMMMLLKLARAIEGEPKEDHWIDMAGYAGIAGELATAMENN